MTGKELLFVLAAGLSLSFGSALADNGEAHLKKYAHAIPGDSTIKAARKLKIKVPVMCREWHVWWNAPHGSYPHLPQWFHWKGQRIFGKFNPNTTIEQTQPGSSWRRWLNCVGYPLLGPYDSSQPDIIRWQLETARNAGLECLHVHLWPSLWDQGRDFTPIPIFDTIMETARKMNYPVALHDEIQFRRPPITKAQDLKNSIERSVLLLKRYGKHPGWYKIDNMPVYYFQNWTKWLKPKDMASYFKTVEKRVGFPVYWIVEMADIDAYFKIPEVKAVISHSNLWFIHTKKRPNGKYPWRELLKNMQRSVRLARKYNKKIGILIMTRFNHNNDRGTKKNPKIISGEEGMHMVNSLRESMKIKPDFVILTQWNDFEECAFIEPAWDYDGNNGDPYRYCRITAACTGKTFKPAPLPKRDQVDPFVRRKLYGNAAKGDMGPIFQKPKLSGRTLSVKWTKGTKPDHVRIIQKELARWTPGLKPFDGSTKLRLGNYSAVNDQGMISGKKELRFYAPGLIASSPKKLWLGIRVYKDPKTRLLINYRSALENFRCDSYWKRATVGLGNGYAYKMPDKTVLYWVPLYQALFAGREGDLLIKLGGSRAKTYIRELIVWDPDMKETRVTPAKSMSLPSQISARKSFVTVAYDKLGNPGQPMLILPHSIKTSSRSNKPDTSKWDFVETFSNLNKWKKLSGAAPYLTEYCPGNQDVPFVSLRNSQIMARLPEPMEQLRLKINMQHTNFSRGNWVALFDESGRKGIGFLWDSSLKKFMNGQGYICIIKFDLKKPLNFSSGFTKLTKPLASGYAVKSSKMASFQLDITPRTITLKANGKNIKASNPIKGPFSKVVIRGNDTGYFDNLLIRKG